MHWSTFARPEILAPFFLLVGLQLRAELTHIRQIALPSFAAIGGMALPALIFILREPTHRNGWPIVAPTDVALVMAAALLLGKRISPALKIFLLALAVADDLFSLVILATKYSSAISLSEFLSTLGAVAVGAALPSLKLPLLKAEIQLTAIVNYLLLPIYILASFAPLLSGPSSVWSSHFALSIALARFIGKPLGISLFVLIASQLPKIFGERTITIGEAVVGGALAGMGLAVSLVITTFTFGSTHLAMAAKAGLVIAIPLSFLLATLAHALHSRSGE
jgi:NhaA family Na+:H+ antiporter